MIEEIRQDKNKLVKTGLQVAKRIGVNARVAALRAYIGGADAPRAALLELLELKPVISDGMVAAHLYGRLRSVLTAAQHIGTQQKSLGTYDTATDFVKKRLELDEGKLALIRAKYGDTATDVTRQMSKAVELKIKVATQEIVEQGMTVRDGVKHLRGAMAKTGTGDNPWLLETLVRTQIEIAYGAGRWNANQDPDIQQILWGYEYVTVGDERVRPSHEALESTRLPKDNPTWDSIWPPNGFSCRCDVIEIFKDEPHKIVDVPEPFLDKNDKEIVPGADEGWGINFGKAYSDMIGAAA